MRVVGRILVTPFVGYGLAATLTAAGPPVFTPVDFPGAILTNAQGVNAQGDVVGTYNDASGQQHGFLRSGGRYRTIDFPNSRVDAPGAAITRVFGINDRGDIVGTFVDSAGRTHGFLAQVSQ